MVVLRLGAERGELLPSPGAGLDDFRGRRRRGDRLRTNGAPDQEEERSGRAEFKRQKITPELAQLIQQLIVENATARPVPTGTPKWLFRRANAHPHLMNSDNGEFKFSMYSREFTPMIANAVAKLGIKAASGNPLKITTRRLRHTYATRLVDEEITPLRRHSTTLTCSTSSCTSTRVRTSCGELMQPLRSGLRLSRKLSPAKSSKPSPTRFAATIPPAGFSARTQWLESSRGSVVVRHSASAGWGHRSLAIPAGVRAWARRTASGAPRRPPGRPRPKARSRNRLPEL